MEKQLEELEAKIEEKTTVAAAVHEKCEQAEKVTNTLFMILSLIRPTKLNFYRFYFLP
jgi:hypothetical protein